jgi:hypothetical protein
MDSIQTLKVSESRIIRVSEWSSSIQVFRRLNISNA